MTRRGRHGISETGPSVLSQKFVVAPRTALRPPGKARRRSRIKEIRRGGATQPGGMQRRPNANEFLGQDTTPAPRDGRRLWGGLRVWASPRRGEPVRAPRAPSGSRHRSVERQFGLGIEEMQLLVGEVQGRAR